MNRKVPIIVLSALLIFVALILVPYFAKMMLASPEAVSLTSGMITGLGLLVLTEIK